MRKKIIKIITILSLLIIYFFILKFFLFEKYTESINYITASVITIILFISIIICGFQKDKINELKKTTLIAILSILLGFFSLYYGIGLFVGYLKSVYAFNAQSIFNNIFPLSIYFISIELLRYVLISYDRENKIYSFFITLTICIFEILVALLGYNISGASDIFKTIAQVILPLAATNYAMSYLTKETGYKSTIIYRLIIGLYPYIVHIIPDLGDFLTAVIKISLPMIIFITTYRLVEDHKNGIEYDFKKSYLKKSDIPMILLLLFLICLISGKFRYQLLGIGSESMSPAISKGDAVFIDKNNKVKRYKKDDIIAYKKDNKIIIHRIVEVTKEKNVYKYKVKGDANNSSDNIILTNKDIEGKILFRIKYIGYPSVFLSENF